MKQQNLHHHHNHKQAGNNHHNNNKDNKGGDNKKEACTEMTDLKHNYAHKRSILRKLMIAQRQMFIAKKEQAELGKHNLAETSISNFSQIDPDENKKNQLNQDGEKDENIKLVNTGIYFLFLT